MRCKKNITCNVRNITLSSSDIFYNSNVSALTYQTSTNIGFTFLPTLNVSLSNDNLTINNLVPGGNAVDSNTIAINVSTNIAEGYNLFATVGGNNNTSNDYNTTNLVNAVDNNYTFTSLSSNVSELSSFTNNTWGYSYCISNCTSASETPNPNWISGDYNNTSTGYNGLPLYTNTGIKLVEEADNTSSTVDFKIAAKAGNTQPSGTYTGTINFIAVTKVAPMSLLDSFIASGAEQLNGYYKMQDMTHDICEAVDIEESELQLIDVRDNKVYWVAKLKDGNCWMTQNLDFSIQEDKQRNIMPLTSETTDLVDNSLAGAYSNGYRYHNDTIIWTPRNTAKTIYFTDMGNPTIVAGWQSSYTEPYSAKEISNSYDDQRSLGVLYNWPAAIASNDSSSLTDNTYYNISNNPQNSICPKNWRLPVVSAYNSYGDFNKLNNIYNEGLTNSDANLLIAPLYFVKAGSIVKENFSGMNAQGVYISSTVMSNKATYGMDLSSTLVRPYEYYNNDFGGKSGGFSVRCLAR